MTDDSATLVASLLVLETVRLPRQLALVPADGAAIARGNTYVRRSKPHSKLSRRACRSLTPSQRVAGERSHCLGLRFQPCVSIDCASSSRGLRPAELGRDYGSRPEAELARD